MAEGVAASYTGATPSEPAAQYRGVSLVECAREILELRGVNVRRLRPNQVIERAMGTTDFPLLLQGTGDRMLLPAYQATPVTYREIARKITNKDFRSKSLIRDGDFPTLLPLNEHGELVAGSMSESGETIKLATVGRKIRLTRQALINDDLGAFTDLLTKGGQAAARYENATVWAVITANAAMSDGTVLFHADHSNLAGSGAAISVTTVGAGKSGIRVQTNGDGNTLNYTPANLIVPSAKEAVAEQYLSQQIVPTKAADVVPASHKQMGLVVEPILDATSATAWYLATDPALLAGIVFAYLEGQEGPILAQRETTDVMGMEFDVVLDFAAAATDHRAMWKNAGA